MSWNRFAERTYHYTHFHVLSRPSGGPFECEYLEELHAAEEDLDIDRRSPLRGMSLEVGRDALTMGLNEQIQDRYVSPDSEEASYTIRTTSHGLLSTAYDPLTGMNTFQRTELLLAEPGLITNRALGCLGVIRTFQEELFGINDPSLLRLIRHTSPAD